MVRASCLDVLKHMPDESIDSFVSDPPYGIELSLQWTGKAKVIRGDGKFEAPKLWREFLPHAARIAKPNTAHVFFGTWKSPWMKDVLDEHFDVKGCIVWFKRQWGLGYYLRPRWELAYYCHKGKPPMPAKAEGDVWEHSRDAKLIHPCQKPIDLLRRAVRLTTQTGRVVCDPFAGIGSTGVAAVLEGCRFIGTEIDKRYCDLGRRRIAAAIKGKDAPQGGCSRA